MTSAIGLLPYDEGIREGPCRDRPHAVDRDLAHQARDGARGRAVRVGERRGARRKRVRPRGG